MEKYRPDIDGLRAIAVAAIVIFHAQEELLPSGYVGVDIFFVISGYLIGRILFNEIRDNNFRFVNFYARRAKRILPALMVVVLACIAFGAFVMTASELRALASHSLYTLIAMSNFTFWRWNDYFASPSSFLPLLMTWSLGVEEQFYLLFPMLLLAVHRLGYRWPPVIMCISAASFALAIVWAFTNPAAAFYLLPARAWELGCGALLACRRGDTRLIPSARFESFLSVVGVASIGIACTMFDGYAPRAAFAVTLSVFGTILLIETRQSFVNLRILSSAPMTFLGRISYSWYLWHWPLMVFARIASPEKPATPVMLGIAAASCFMGYLSWRFIEQPFRLVAMPASRSLFLYGAALAAVFAVTFGVKLAGGFPSRLPPSVAAIEEMVVKNPVDCLSPYGAAVPDDSETCMPRKKGGPAIALIGDSHANALRAGLLAAADNQGLRLIQLTKAACTPLLGYAGFDPKRPREELRCAAFMQKATDLIVDDPSVKTVVVAAIWPWDDRSYLQLTPQGEESVTAEMAIESGLQALLSKLTAAGKKVLLIGDVPYFTFDPARRAISSAIPGRRFFAGLLSDEGGISNGNAMKDHVKTRSNNIYRILDAQGTKPNVSYIDLANQFCNHDSCKFAEGDVLLYIDWHHLSTFGSRAVLWPKLVNEGSISLPVNAVRRQRL